VDEHKINYRVVVGTEELSQLYGGIDALPTTFIIDRSGRIAMKHEGLVSKGEYQNEILDLLNGKTLQKSAAVPRGVPAFFWTK
jgi:peroxiredoxin